MRFWDTSALVPLLVRQRASGRMRSLYRSDPGVLAWWGARIECESAISRLERDGLLKGRSAVAARGRLDPLRESARRLLRVHDLRAADTLQLAAGLAAAEGRPATLAFVCLDARLGSAAEREGFPLLGVDRPTR